jgi:hypothetical protein
MPARRTPADHFRARLADLSRAVSEDLRLPSLKEQRLDLKPILKTAGHIEQQEILISRIECRLM